MLERGLVALSALVFGGIGAWTLIDPIPVLAEVGVVISDARGLVELRAMYGGMELGFAAFLIWTLLSPARVRTGLLAATLTIGTMGVVRLAGLLTAETEGWALPVLCGMELVGTTLGVYALIRGRRG